jgi:hypothetical protein
MINCAIHYRIRKLLKETKYSYTENNGRDPMYSLWVHFVQSVYKARVTSVYIYIYIYIYIKRTVSEYRNMNIARRKRIIHAKQFFLLLEPCIS